MLDQAQQAFASFGAALFSRAIGKRLLDKRMDRIIPCIILPALRIAKALARNCVQLRRHLDELCIHRFLLVQCEGRLIQRIAG